MLASKYETYEKDLSHIYDPGPYKVHFDKGSIQENNPKVIEGDGVKPIVEITDSGNPTFLIAELVP